jgi:hypothetical protein
VTVSNKAGTSDLEELLKTVLTEVRDGARDIVLTRLAVERPSTAAASFVRLLLRHRKDLGISVSVDPPEDVPVEGVVGKARISQPPSDAHGGGRGMRKLLCLVVAGIALLPATASAAPQIRTDPDDTPEAIDI